MSTTTSLLPCPFCGGEAVRITLTREDGPDNEGGDVISCQRCGASSHVEFGFKENLVDSWNRRAGADVVEKLAALRETFCYASPGSDAEFTSLLLGFDTAAAVIFAAQEAKP